MNRRVKIREIRKGKPSGDKTFLVPEQVADQFDKVVASGASFVIKDDGRRLVYTPPPRQN